MVETYATSQYREKFLGNLTFTQTLILLALAAPGVLAAVRGAAQVYVLAYGIFLVATYAAMAFYEADELAARWISYKTSKRRLLWNTKDMREFIGVCDIDGGCVYTKDARILSIVKVHPKDLGGLSDSDLARVLAGYGSFLHELSTSIQIIMSSKEIDMEDYLRHVKESVIISGKEEKLKYFDHLSDFTRRVVASKTITDRDYHIVITNPKREKNAKSIEELDNKTKNLMTALNEAGIGCRRLTTDELICFYANVYQPKSKTTNVNAIPLTVSGHDQTSKEAQFYVRAGISELFDMPMKEIAIDNSRCQVTKTLDRRSHVMEQLMPAAVDIHKDHAEVEKLHKILYTVRFPAIVHPGWLTKLIRQPIDFDIVFHIHPLTQKTSIQYLQYEITKLETDVTTKQNEGMLVAEKDRVNLQKVRELLNKVARDEEKCFDVALYVDVKAYTKNELDTAAAKIRDVLEGMSMHVNTANWEMEDALVSCYPIAKDKLGDRRDRMFPSSAVRDSYPFILSSLDDADGKSIVVGYNQLNGIPVIFDIYGQQNPHIMVLGSSGSGKSFLVKKLFLAMTLQDADIFIIDPQGEYSNLVEMMGGEVIRLSPDSKNSINIFDIRDDTYDGRKASIKAFFNILRCEIEGELSGATLGIIDKMIDNAYKKAGIYCDNHETQKRTPPTFTDVYESLNQFVSDGNNTEKWKKATAEALLAYLTPFISGDLRHLNRQTNLDLSGKNIVSFDISQKTSYKPLEKSLILFIVFDYIQRWTMRQSPAKRKMIIVDEAWCVFENNQDYLGPIVRTGRKNNLSVVMIDQNAEDLLAKDETGVPKGYIILNNTATKFILRQEHAGLKLVCESFGLTRSQETFIKTAGVGDALMLTPDIKLPIYILASEREKMMLSTTPEEMKRPIVKKQKIPDVIFDIQRDSVLPTDELKKDDITRLKKEGYVAYADTGLGGEKRIYYVRGKIGECTAAIIKKTLIRKHIERICRLKGLSPQDIKLISGTGYLPDITFELSGAKYVIEIIDCEKLGNPRAEVRAKLNILRDQTTYTVLFAAVDAKTKESAEGMGYKKVALTEDITDALNDMLAAATEMI